MVEQQEVTPAVEEQPAEDQLMDELRKLEQSARNYQQEVSRATSVPVQSPVTRHSSSFSPLTE